MSVKQAKNSMGEDRADNEALLEPLTFSAFSDATPGSFALRNDMATVELIDLLQNGFFRCRAEIR